MILGDCGAGRCRVPRSPRPVDRVDWTVGALKEWPMLDVEAPGGSHDALAQTISWGGDREE
jgi:hypothetical protein